MSKTSKTPAFCTQCRSRCGCVAVVEEGRLTGIEPLPTHPSGEKLCPKGQAAPELVYHPDRLTRPLRRISPKGAPPEFEPIAWDAALDEIAGHMARIRADHGSEQVVFSVTTPSGTHISDSILWIERFIRAYGSPNIIYGTEICNWHKDFATRLTYGSDIGTPDFANTDCVLLWGNNPAATWLARSVEVQKAQKRGAKLVVVDPRPTLFARRADCWLQVRPGTDQALALGLLHRILKEERFATGFASKWTNAAFLVRRDTGALLRESHLRPDGSDQVFFAEDRGKLVRYDAATATWLDAPDRADRFNLWAAREVDTLDGPVMCLSALTLLAEAAAPYTPVRTAELTGVPEDKLHQAADILRDSHSVAYYAWNGVAQSPTATQTDRAISILYALLGSYGDRGGNVPGGAAAFADITGQDLLSEAQRAKNLDLTARPLGPGLGNWVTARDTYRAVLEHDPYPVRMLFSFGGNLLASQPDTDRALAAFDALEFHVHTDFFLNGKAEHADIVLPVATSWEREGLRAGFDASLEGMRRVQLRPAVVDPVGEARSDIDILLALSERLGLSSVMFDGDVDKGHDQMLAPAGLDSATLRANPEGVTIATAVPLRAFETAGFATPSKRIELYSERLLAIGQPPVPALDAADLPTPPGADFPIRLTCAKTLAFCHSQHRNIPSLRRLVADPELEMSDDLAAGHSIAAGDWVRVETAAGAFVARARIDGRIAPGTVIAQHGWGDEHLASFADLPEDAGSANVNRAIPTDRADPISGSIPMRCAWCRIAKLNAA